MAARPSSSLYSRSTGSVNTKPVPATSKQNRLTVSSIPDQPFVTTVDHEIRDLLGHSTAIDASASRLQILKRTRDKYLPAEERTKIRNWELDCICWENEFFKARAQDCRNIEHDLQDIAQKLESEYQTRLLQHYFEPEEPIPNDEFLHWIREKVDSLLFASLAQERRGVEKWKAYWDKPWV